MRTRFAPSPTGLLHLGHAWSAHVAFHAAHSQNSAFLVRIEDIDPSRAEERFVHAQLNDLTWLGFTPDAPPVKQSERKNLYRAALNNLHDKGLLYPCFCSRKTIQQEIEASASAPHKRLMTYPGTCKRLDAVERQARLDSGEANVWRLNSEQAAQLTGPLFWHDRHFGKQTVHISNFGDVVLWRKDDWPAYHLAVVVDDAATNIERVTRGMDLFDTSAIHRLLQAILGLDVPLWQHHGLVTDQKGRRLAKRHDAEAIAAFRDRGFSPEAVINLAKSRLVSGKPEPFVF